MVTPVSATAAMQLDDLRPEVVMAAATQATGLDDFGEHDFVEGLTILLDDLRNESRLSAHGVAMQFQDIVRMLSNRLGFERDLKRHPEILDEKIERPIMIFGLPRSGTSKLQRMMSADPEVQRLDLWRLFFPAPLPGTEGIQPDPRIGITEQIEALFRSQSPALMASHAMEAHEPDEEVWLFEMTFESAISSHKVYAPNHRDWVAQRSQRKPYAYLKKLLQYLQWQDGGAIGTNGERPWILKSPFHIGELPLVMETFPDATIAYCHRDPRTVMASFASVITITRRMYSDAVDPCEVGADLTRRWGLQVERHLAARRALGEHNIVDIYFEDIRDNAEQVIAQIYARAGRELTPKAAQAFAAYAARRPEGHFGKHEYALGNFGLDDASIETAFPEYMQRFFNPDRSSHPRTKQMQGATP